MPDLLEQSQEWLTSMNRVYRSRQVTYARGAQTKEVPALVGKTVFKVDTGYGLFERVEARDYLVLAAELVLGGATALPKAGDRIREVEGEKAFVYEVMAPGGEPCWRWSDPYRRTLRIHTKHVATEDV